jgi:hypothetical protein
MLSDGYRIARKSQGFFLDDSYASRGPDVIADCRLSIGIKSRWEPEQLAPGQRTETRIQMIETGIDQLYR